MKNRMNDLDRTKGKQSQRQAWRPVRQQSQRNVDETTGQKSPDVNRIVDDIFLKYNDFGWADRD